MNKINALEAYKISIILEDVSFKWFKINVFCILVCFKIVVLGFIEVKHGRRNE
jgi:hypothetical protein